MTDTEPKSPPSPPAARIAIALVLVFAWVLLTFVLPNIPLDGEAANLAVHVSDSADWGGLPLWSVAALALLISRPGLQRRRRVVEGVALAVAMVVALAGNAILNERVIKPEFAEPRPNIIALTDAHALGASIREPADFYALGDKEVRSQVLRARLDKLDEPALSPLVREHWISESGYSFPSGHSTAAMTFASMLIALSVIWGLSGWRKVLTTSILPIWAVAVVWSRVLLEVHSPFDVSGGTLAGFAWGLGACLFVHACAKRFGGEPPG